MSEIPSRALSGQQQQIGKKYGKKQEWQMKAILKIANSSEGKFSSVTHTCDTYAQVHSR